MRYTVSALLSILGPTASGKSQVALELARRLDGEIVACDSMTVYRGLDIGTAKPTLDERREIPHHLIDILDIHEPCDARTFCRLADIAIRDILARGRQPILCGGTGLYAKALLYGLPLQPGDPAVAEAIRHEYRRGGIEPLVAELAATDPQAAERTRDNPRRLMRALEIVRITAAPVAPDEPNPPPYAAPEFILIPDSQWTRERILQRTISMLDAGWIGETERLISQGLLGTPTASQALGYPQIATWLAGPRASWDELVETLVRLTNRYAKRQRTWFRHQHPKGIQLPVHAGCTNADLVSRILADR